MYQQLYNMLKGVLTGMHHYIVCNTSQNIVSESCNKPNQNIFGMLGHQTDNSKYDTMEKGDYNFQIEKWYFESSYW